MKYNISTNYHTLNHWQSCKKRKKKTSGWPKYGDWGKNCLNYSEWNKYYIKYGYIEKTKPHTKYIKYGKIENPRLYPKYGKNENARFYVKFGVIE